MTFRRQSFSIFPYASSVYIYEATSPLAPEAAEKASIFQQEAQQQPAFYVKRGARPRGGRIYEL